MRKSKRQSLSHVPCPAPAMIRQTEAIRPSKGELERPWTPEFHAQLLMRHDLCMSDRRDREVRRNGSRG